MKLSPHTENAFRNKITRLSYLLALTVVLRHSLNSEVYGVTGWLAWAEQRLDQATDLAVPLFFTLSGFLFYRNFQITQLKRKLVSRLFSLVIPYLLWNVIAWLYFELLCAVPFIASRMNAQPEPFTFMNFIRNALLGEHTITWFLRVLAVYTYLLPLTWLLLKRPWGALALLAGSLGLLLLYPQDSYVIYLPMYLAGACLGLHAEGIVKQKLPAAVRLGTAAVLLASLLIDFHPGRGYTLLRLCQAAALWVALDGLASEKAVPWWMGISFFIYCAHSMVLEAVEKIFYLVLGPGNTGAALDLICAPVITASLLTLAAWILKKLPPLWKVLSGNR